MQPPCYPKRAASMTAHGDTRQLPFYWMRDASRAEELRSILQQENEFAAAAAASFFSPRRSGGKSLRSSDGDGDRDSVGDDDHSLVRAIRRECRERVFASSAILPVRRGGYYYYEREVVAAAAEEHRGHEKSSTGGSSSPTSFSEDERLCSAAAIARTVFVRIPAAVADAWAAKRLKKAQRPSRRRSKAPHGAHQQQHQHHHRHQQRPHFDARSLHSDFLELCARTFTSDVHSGVPRHPRAEQVVLDPAQLSEAENVDSGQVVELVVSPSEEMLAVCVDRGQGAEEHEVLVFCIGSHACRFRSPASHRCAAFVEWGASDAELFYVTQDATTARPFQVMCATIDPSDRGCSRQQSTSSRRGHACTSRPCTSPVWPVSQLCERDPTFEVSSLRSTEDGAFLVCELANNLCSETWVLPRLPQPPQTSSSSSSSSLPLPSPETPGGGGGRGAWRCAVSRAAGIRHHLSHYSPAHSVAAADPQWPLSDSFFLLLVSDEFSPQLGDGERACSSGSTGLRLRPGVYRIEDTGALRHDGALGIEPPQCVVEQPSGVSFVEIHIRARVLLITARRGGYQNVFAIDMARFGHFFARCIPRSAADRLGERELGAGNGASFAVLTDAVDVACLLAPHFPPCSAFRDVHTLHVIDSWYGDPDSFFLSAESLVVPETGFRVAFAVEATGCVRDDDADEVQGGAARVAVVFCSTPRKFHAENFSQQLHFVPLPAHPIPHAEARNGAGIEECAASTLLQPIPFALAFDARRFENGASPMIIHVYGSYGECSDPSFDPDRLSLLERGFVYAVAGVRGGGEWGQTWRAAGSGLRRQAAVDDLIACAEYAIRERLCDPARIVLTGESAAGMIVGAALNQRPELFRGVHLRVPFVDVLTTMLDEAGQLTVGEWLEWGNPVASQAAYECIKALSPTDNISVLPVVLPNVLIESGWRDTRVSVAEPATWCAMLRDVWPRASEGAGRVLLHRCRFDAGHGTVVDGGDEASGGAFAMAFLLACAEIYS